jgi:hypothetical protein
VPIYAIKRISMQDLLLDRVIQVEGVFVYNMHNILEKHFSISSTRAKTGRVTSSNIKMTINERKIILPHILY